jgi:hypothetical protein
MDPGEKAFSAVVTEVVQQMTNERLAELLETLLRARSQSMDLTMRSVLKGVARRLQPSRVEPVGALDA